MVMSGVCAKRRIPVNHNSLSNGCSGSKRQTTRRVEAKRMFAA